MIVLGLAAEASQRLPHSVIPDAVVAMLVVATSHALIRSSSKHVPLVAKADPRSNRVRRKEMNGMPCVRVGGGPVDESELKRLLRQAIVLLASAPLPDAAELRDERIRALQQVRHCVDAVRAGVQQLVHEAERGAQEDRGKAATMLVIKPG